MTPVISRDCACGRQFRATDPLPGQTMRCIYCGATMVYEGDGPRSETPPAPTDPMDVPKIDFRTEVDLTCPGCGGRMATLWKGRGDKIAECEYCGHTVDLPEKRGFTRERITRGPGSETVERVTQWFEEVGGDDGHEPPTLDPADVDEAIIDFYGEQYDSLEELEQMLSSRLSPEQARSILAELKASIKAK